MARNNGRWGRLRRVLSEDLSTSTVTYTTASDRAPGDTPRYGAGANIENHPQVTDYVPRRFRTMSLILAAGTGLIGLAETIAHQADTLSTVVGVSAAQLTETLSNQLVSWASAVALVVTAAYARIVFLLRRHRLDDLRGRYQAWRLAGWLAILLSANCVMSYHSVLAQMIGHLTGWHPLGGDAAWWIIPGIVVGGWVMLRLILDASECRSALLALIVSALCFILAIACAAGWTPLQSAIWSAILTRSLPLVGYLCVLAGTLLTARYVVLDVQGLIERDTVPARPSASASSRSSRSRASATDEKDSSEEKEVATAWVDGSEPEDGDSDDDRPLSKAERKRLRKQQGRYRAA
jgi:hypothetical protein